MSASSQGLVWIGVAAIIWYALLQSLLPESQYDWRFRLVVALGLFTILFIAVDLLRRLWRRGRP